jgi:predicted  nucleic acid-binding Zn-ribbon protein
MVIVDMILGLAMMVFGIVLVVTIGSIVRARMGIVRDNQGNEFSVRDPALNEENRQLRHEITSLKDRIAVLERVITDTNGSSANLDREIEALRNRDR